MTLLPPNHNIEWLIDSDEKNSVPTQVGAAAETKRIAFPYPSEIGSGFSEHTQTRDGIVLIQDAHHFNVKVCPPSIPLGNFSVTFPEPVFCINTIHSGQISITEKKSKQTMLRHSGVDGFTHAMDYSLDQTVITSESLHTTALLIPVSQLKKLIEVETIEIMFEMLGISKLDNYGFHPLPGSISKILEHCLDHSLRDTLKAMQLQARFLDYLCSLSIYLGSDIVTAQNQNPSKARAQAIHNYLLSVGNETPTLGFLSEKFGSSPNKLNIEFTSVYNESIFSFLTNYRLEQARLALEKSSQPLKVIAHRIGYSHVNHFITAFKRKYGCTPGSFRNDSSKE